MKKTKHFNLLIFFLLIILISCNNKKNQSNKSEIDLTKAKEYFEKGKKKMDYNDFRGAVQDFNKARKYNPEYFDAFIYAGNCENKLGNDVSAGQNYSAAIGIDPNSGYAYYLRGMNLIQMAGETARDAGCYDFSKSAELGYYKAKGAIQRYCN